VKRCRNRLVYQSFPPRRYANPTIHRATDLAEIRSDTAGCIPVRPAPTPPKIRGARQGCSRPICFVEIPAAVVADHGMPPDSHPS